MTSMGKRIPNVCTCIALGKTRAPVAAGKLEWPKSPLVRAVIDEAQRTLSAKTSPASVVRIAGTWSRLRAAVDAASDKSRSIRRWPTCRSGSTRPFL
jgi:hypothetical protein